MGHIEKRPRRDDGPAGAETVFSRRRCTEPHQDNASHRESQPFPSDDELYVEVCRAARNVTEADRDWLEEHGVADRKLADWGDLGAAQVKFLGLTAAEVEGVVDVVISLPNFLKRTADARTKLFI